LARTQHGEVDDAFCEAIPCACHPGGGVFVRCVRRTECHAWHSWHRFRSSGRLVDSRTGRWWIRLVLFHPSNDPVRLPASVVALWAILFSGRRRRVERRFGRFVPRPHRRWALLRV
jgi:hypothetical protein